jgi:xanthine/CO dehydrogenase XdhC/CoxF family maturation factor
VPPEIALSILAEVLAVTRGRPGSTLSIVDASAVS